MIIMHEMILKKGEIMDFNFFIHRKESVHGHQDIELFYVVEGELTLLVSEDKYLMQQDDFIIINSNKPHSYIAQGEVLICCIHIAYQQLSELLLNDHILLWCNTVVDKSEVHSEIRSTVKLILNQYFDKDKIGCIHLKSLYYNLLHLLSSNFLVSTNDQVRLNDSASKHKRQEDIIQYVKLNFHRPISLSDLGSKLFLSEAYLSKYIKKHFGINFMMLVNHERLNHAIESLLYSDLSITRIALDNGFPNTAAFNKLFKETYHMTPSAYQAERKESTKRKKVRDHKSSNEMIEQKILDYYDRSPTPVEVDRIKNEILVNVNIQQHRELKRNWNQMINIGEAVMILRADVQEHLKLLKNELGFTYIRFWDIWNMELYLNTKKTMGNYNFDTINQILDFLVSQQMKPYLELGFKPRKIISAMNKTLLIEKNSLGFDHINEYHGFLRAFLSQSVNRYGMKEVETWIFELWKDESNDESLTFYFEVFDSTYDILKSFSKKIRLGGAGLSLRFGMKNFYDILQEWEKRKIKPDFLSLYMYPYVPGEDEGTRYIKHSTDSKFVENQLVLIEQVLEETRFPVRQLHVTEWNLTVSQRNIMNDSCFKGAYVMKSIMDSIDHADLMGYWIGTDLFGRYYDSHAFLYGGGGLISKDGIRKPSFYAYQFMNQLGELLIYKDEHCMVTRDQFHSYTVICQNYKHLNYQYYMKSEDELDLRKQSSLFNDQESLQYDIRLNHVKKGTYRLKIHSVNAKQGSVQDEWLRWGYYEQLSGKEIDYLKSVSIPRIQMRTIEVEDQVMSLSTSLEPNEIQWLQVVYQY